MEKLTSINIKSIVEKVNEIIDSIKSAPEQYDDTKLRKELDKQIADINKRQDDLARSQNAMDKAFKAIEIPKVPSVEPLRKRIKALEDKPQYIYDDKAIKNRVNALETAPKYVYDDSEVIKRISALESKPQYDDKSLKERVKKLESTPEYTYDDTEINKRLNELEVKPQYDDSALRERLTALESKPDMPTIEKYDDRKLVSKLSDIEKSIESLDKRLDFVKRTYSEKWETMQFAKVSNNKELNDKLSGFESDIAEIKDSLKEILE